MYQITQEDFLQIRAEALEENPEAAAFTVTFEVMERMFPPYLYARRGSFPCKEDLEDCLMTAEMRIAQRLRRYYFERADMEQTPESLQRWMFAVLKNCHYTVLRQSEAGREVLNRLQQQTARDLGVTYTGDGQMILDEGNDGGFDDLFRREETAQMRDLLSRCFTETAQGKNDVQILLAWMTVGALMLCRDMKKKDAIALISDADPTMRELLSLLRRLLSQLDWLTLTDRDWTVIGERLDRMHADGRSVGDLKFGDFTGQSTREYISKSINKRNDAFRRSASDLEFEF